MVETMNNIGNRQPDSNAGCSKQKGVKNKQTRQLVLVIFFGLFFCLYHYFL